MKIPQEYYKSDMCQPIVHNVAELKARLQELPDGMPIEIGFSDAVQLVVYNHGTPDMHLTFLEVD